MPRHPKGDRLDPDLRAGGSHFDQVGRIPSAGEPAASSDASGADLSVAVTRLPGDDDPPKLLNVDIDQLAGRCRS